MTIAVTGGSGFVGQAMLDVLNRRKIPTRALARKARGSALRRGNVEWIKGDLSDAQALRTLVHGAEAVIHIAGLTSTVHPEEFEEANVTGTLNLIEAAVELGVPRLIFVSSLAAREPELSAYGASKARAEKLVAASGLDWTMVRPPGVYGPRDKDMLDLFRMARRGVVTVPPPGATSLIHVYDLAELLADLQPTSEWVTRQIFEPDDGRDGGWSHREFALAIGRSMGRRARVLHLSEFWLSLASRLDRLFRRDKAKLTADRVGYMLHPDWVASADLAVPEALWHAKIPTKEGLKDTANWYRINKWL